jgi:hypothetical protein
MVAVIELFQILKDTFKGNKPHGLASLYINTEGDSEITLFSLCQIFQLCELAHGCSEILNIVGTFVNSDSVIRKCLYNFCARSTCIFGKEKIFHLIIIIIISLSGK